MNRAEAIDWATDRLEAKQIEDARLEAEILLVHALGIKKSDLILNQSLNLDSHNFEYFKAWVERRLKHEPTAYITGVQPFMSLDFFVDRSVLIPRPETELLVETVLRVTGHESRITIADIGTGSGCIAISLAKHLPNIAVIGIDSSAKAIEIAKKNAEKHKVSGRCNFIAGNIFETLKEKVNFIVSNPPYVPSKQIDKLQPEVKNWEPRSALDGGQDGLDYVRKIIEKSPDHLTTAPPGSLFIEFGFNQSEEIKRLAETANYSVEIIGDYSRIPRIAHLTRS
jgi:release factor glutamine methyltransferase